MHARRSSSAPALSSTSVSPAPLAPEQLLALAPAFRAVLWATQIFGPVDLFDRSAVGRILGSALQLVCQWTIEKNRGHAAVAALSNAIGEVVAASDILWTEIVQAFRAVELEAPPPELLVSSRVPVRVEVDGRTSYVWAPVGMRIVHRTRAALFDSAIKQPARLVAIIGKDVVVELLDGGLGLGIEETWRPIDFELPPANAPGLERAVLSDLERFGIT